MIAYVLKDPCGLYYTGADTAPSTRQRRALRFASAVDATRERSVTTGAWPLCRWVVVRLVAKDPA